MMLLSLLHDSLGVAEVPGEDGVASGAEAAEILACEGKQCSIF